MAGFNWAYDLTPVAKEPVNADGIAYVSHPYPMKREKPWEPKWTADWGFVAEKYPVILTEIGFCGADEKGAHVPVISDESYGDAITKYCAEKYCFCNAVNRIISPYCKPYRYCKNRIYDGMCKFIRFPNADGWQVHCRNYGNEKNKRCPNCTEPKPATAQ